MLPRQNFAILQSCNWKRLIFISIILIAIRAYLSIPLERYDGSNHKFGIVEVQAFSNYTTLHGVDVVFVHGLAANPDTTWTRGSEVQTNGSTVDWIRDFLPHDLPTELINDIRVFHYNHDTRYWSKASVTRLSWESDDLVEHLVRKLKTQEHQRNLIFVCHSYGGLIVKKALASIREHARLEHIAKRTSGIMFLGTPHLGSNGANWIRLVLRLLWYHSPNFKIIDEITPDSDLLMDLHKEFQNAFGRRIKVVNFYERHPLTKKIWTLQFHSTIVAYRSATYVGDVDFVINRGLNADHSGLNKFTSRTSNYETVMLELAALLKPLQLHTESITESLVNTFVPRNSLFEAAADAFSKCDDESHCAILYHGLGGSGKTQLARSLVEEWRAHYSIILWIDARNYLSMVMSFRRFARQLGLPEPSDTPAVDSPSSEMQSVITWIVNNYNPTRRWLLIFDDVDTVTRSQLKAAIPSTTNGHIILTSRMDFACTLVQGECSRINVDSMTPTEAGELILRYLNTKPDLAGSELLSLAQEVSELVGRLAIGVKSIGAYLMEQDDEDCSTRLVQFREDFYRHQRTLLVHEPWFESTEYSFTVWTVWNMTVAKLETKWPQYKPQNMLVLLSHFDHTMISDDIFRLAGASYARWSTYYTQEIKIYLPDWIKNLIHFENGKWDSFLFRKAVESLARSSLIRRQQGSEIGSSMHMMVQWRYQQDRGNEDWSTWVLFLMNCALDTVLSSPAETSLRRILLSHVMQLQRNMDTLDCAERNKNLCVLAMQNIGRFYLEEGYLIDALQIHEHLYKMHVSRSGNESLQSMQAYADLARVIHSQGYWDQAAKMHEYILQVFRTLLPPEHDKILTTMQYLADAYVDLEDYERGEQLSRAVLVIRTRAKGLQDHATISSMNQLAVILAKQGNIQEAEDQLVQAIKLTDSSFGTSTSQSFTLHANLATFYSLARRLSSAQTVYEHLLLSLQAKHPRDHPLILTTMSNLAYNYQDQQNWTAAESTFRELLELRLSKYRANHHEVLDTRASIAGILYHRGRSEEAVTMMADCARIAAQTFGPEHPYSVKFGITLIEWTEKPTIWKTIMEVFAHGARWRVLITVSGSLLVFYLVKRVVSLQQCSTKIGSRVHAARQDQEYST